MKTKQTMMGSPKFPFSAMVQDTIAKHGVEWAFNYYVVKNDLPIWQWQVFSGQTKFDFLHLSDLV